MKIGQNTYIMKYEKPNSWTHFDPLKQVVIGNVYDPSFFDDLKDDSIRESIQKVYCGGARASRQGSRYWWGASRETQFGVVKKIIFYFLLLSTRL